MDVPEGAITAVLGANGAGKTTLLRTVSGLVRTRSGSVTLDGKELTRAPVEQIVGRGMAQVPEGRGVVAELTVEENLRLGGLFRKDKDGRRGPGRCTSCSPRSGERRKRAASTLSGGERQMLVVGRALMARPRVLLLDEPSLGLAPLVARQILDLVRRLFDRAGWPSCSSSRTPRARWVADTGVVLNLGKVVAIDARPRSPPTSGSGTPTSASSASRPPPGPTPAGRSTGASTVQQFVNLTLTGAGGGGGLRRLRARAWS